MSFKEVDPAAQPSADAHATGGGGGAGAPGEDVPIKEVDPAPKSRDGGLTNPGTLGGFNPQPDPPGLDGLVGPQTN